MNKLLFLGALLLNSWQLHAQTSFEKVIDTLECDYGTCIKQTFDGGFVLCGKSNLGGNDAFVCKLDSIGNIEWAKVYSGPGVEAATYIEQTPDSGYMVNALYDGGLFSNTWLLRLNAQGDTLWTQTFSAGIGGTKSSEVNSMASVNNAVYGMTGYFRPQPSTVASAFFIASIGNGFPVSTKVYNYSILGSQADAISNTEDGGFIISGAIATSTSLSDYYLLKTDAYGDTIWTKTYDKSATETGFSVQQTMDKGYIIAGTNYNSISLHRNIFLIKTDSIGDTLWTKEYLNTSSNISYSIRQAIDSGYFLTGILATPPSNLGDIYVIKTDSLGNVLWTKQYGGVNNDEGYFGRQTSDGGYIISGRGAIGNRFGAYIIKTDSLGNVANSIGIAELNNPLSFEVYPNPVHDQFTIKLRGMPAKETRIEMYDIRGKLVSQYLVCNSTEENVSCKDLKPGLYTLLLRKGNEVFTRKVVVSGE